MGAGCSLCLRKEEMSLTVCRLGGLVFLLAIQMWVAWAFVSSQLERTRKKKKT